MWHDFSFKKYNKSHQPSQPQGLYSIVTQFMAKDINIMAIGVNFAVKNIFS
jgi:hypothetical protein